MAGTHTATRPSNTPWRWLMLGSLTAGTLDILPQPPTAVWVTGVLVHMFFIGVPITLAARSAFVSVATPRDAAGVPAASSFSRVTVAHELALSPATRRCEGVRSQRSGGSCTT